jgi:peptidyl-prolyl cis-trans isomerase C
MKKLLIVVILNVVAFVAGSHLWKITKGGRSLVETLGWKSSQSQQHEVLAYVDGKEILVSDVEQEVVLFGDQITSDQDLTQNASFSRSKRSLREYILQQIIERRVVLGYLQRQGVSIPCTQNPENESDPFFTRIKCEHDLVEDYLQKNLYGNIEVSESEAKEYYDKHPEEQKVPAQIQFRQIVLATEQDAEKARRGLNASNFAQRAQELSIAPEALEGGLLPPMSKQELPPSLDVIFQLYPGQIHGIIKSTFGFHIVLLEKKVPARVLSFEQNRELIYRKILERKKKETYDKWFELALSFASIRQSL